MEASRRRVERLASGLGAGRRWLLAAGALAALGWSCTSQVIEAGPTGAGGATTSTSAPGSGGTTSSSSGTTSSSSGTGGCATAADCPSPNPPCVTAACIGGVCGTANVPKVVLAQDSPPDCHDTACDGMGHLTKMIDVSNTPDTTNPCLVGSCDATGTPGTAPAPAGTACTSAGGKVCDGMGACVECLTNSDCKPSEMCAQHVCVIVEPCADGVKDGAETDVDCGGPACAPCAVGKQCKVDSDCVSNSCDAVTLTCVSCDCCDHQKDGTETDVDCGGGFCPGCALGKHCNVDADCASNACDAISLTCVSNQCLDHRKDGAESDIDCGGGTCPGCDVGKQCNTSFDCLPGHVCSTGVCM